MMIVKNEAEINGVKFDFFVDYEAEEKKKYYGIAYTMATLENPEDIKEITKGWFRAFALPKDFSSSFTKVRYEEMDGHIYIVTDFKFENIQF